MSATIIPFRQKSQRELCFQVRFMTNEGLRFTVLFANSYAEMVTKLPASCNRIISTRVG